MLALVYLPTESPTPYHYRALKQLLARESQGCGIILGAEKAPRRALDHRILFLPYTMVL